jgi:hypothetical protein
MSMRGKKIPERRSGLRPTENELMERRFWASRHKKISYMYIYLETSDY